MTNYISINNQKIELTEDQIKQIINAYNLKSITLADVTVGETVKIGDYELVVLEQLDGKTALILKSFYSDNRKFGKGNNYNGSCADERCQEFAGKLAEIIGWDNIVLHKVDLTSDDGLKDYGTIERRASLITAEMYRKYVEILDTVNPKKWWLLATAATTEKHEDACGVKCVSPSGCINGGHCISNVSGLRPFCILKSNIIVSK